MSSILGRVVATERTPEHAARVPLLDRARLAGRHRHDRARRRTRCRSNGVIPHVYGVVTEGFSYTDLAVAAARRHRARRHAASADARARPSAPRSGSTPRPCCARSRRSRCSRCRWATVLPRRRSRRRRRAAHGRLPQARARAPASRSACTAPAAPTSPIYLDADFLVGPEAAHLNITGVSGLATKTSAVEWLLAVDLHALPGAEGIVAAVCFNVKGPDLCFLDQPGELDDARPRAVREAAACRAEPFENVQYFAPYKSRRRLAQHAALERGAARQRHAAHVGAARGAAVRRSAAQQGRRRREGRCADRLHQGARARQATSATRCSSARASRAVVRRPRRVVPRRAARAGGEGRRELAHAPRRDDPQGAQPPLEHLARAARASSPTTAPSSDLPFGSFRGSHGVRGRRRERSRRTRRI